jgi:DNA invertase Pin-like site-specific DNA recombinase
MTRNVQSMSRNVLRESSPLELQLRELREYARLRGLTIVGEYIDRISGSKDSRPALNQLMADASQRKFDAVLVWKLDRFGRSLRHLVNALAELEALGLTFISLHDNLDLSTPSGRLMFQIIGAMAEFERSLIQERVKAGLRNARAKGKRLGRPPIFVSHSRLDTLRASGASWRAISKELGWGWERPTDSPSSVPKTPAGVAAQAPSRARSESSSIRTSNKTSFLQQTRGTAWNTP